ncbi:DNA-binding response regulator [Butyricicoccus sp. 1XD8-22]|nr:DNA-binding response regulator [Butyricicoccus sp. 1XD8-22]
MPTQKLGKIGRWGNLNIAICEDDLPQAKIISLYLQKMTDEYHIQKVHYYPNGEKLFIQIEAGAHFDVFLLDIELPGISGIELGSLIQKRYPHAIIIYISGHTQYISAAFHQRNTQYLLKPIKRVDLEQIFRVLRDELRNRLFYGRTSANNVLSIPFSEIVYAEFYHSTLILHTIHADQSFVGEFKSQKLAFREKGFIQTHQGYFVNPKHISYILDAYVYCTNAATVPISARQRKQVREQFVNYLRKTHLMQSMT